LKRANYFVQAPITEDISTTEQKERKEKPVESKGKWAETKEKSVETKNEKMVESNEKITESDVDLKGLNISPNIKNDPILSKYVKRYFYGEDRIKSNYQSPASTLKYQTSANPEMGSSVSEVKKFSSVF